MNPTKKPATPQQKSYLKGRNTILAAILIYIVLYMILLLWGRGFLSPDAAGAYSIGSSYICLPVSSFIISTVTGGRTKYLRFLMPIIFSFTGWLLPLLVFGASGRIFVWVVFIPSIIGIILGTVITKRKRQ